LGASGRPATMTPPSAWGAGAPTAGCRAATAARRVKRMRVIFEAWLLLLNKVRGCPRAEVV